MQKLFFLGMVCLLSCAGLSQTVDTTKIYPINEVVVSATRKNSRLKDIPQKVEVIGQNVIATTPADNMAELLKRTTNLDMIQYPGLSASVGMRGFSPSAHSRSYTLLLINGVPTATTNLAALSTDNVERIEVVKGPYSVLYGSDAMGGIINIVTKEASAQPGGSVSVAAGSFGSMKLGGNVSGNLSEKTAVALGFSKSSQLGDYRIGRNSLMGIEKTEKLMLDEKSYGDVMLNSQWQTQQANGQVVHRLGHNYSLGIDASVFNADDVETPGNYWGSYGESKKDVNRANVSAFLTGQAGRNSFRIAPYFADENTRNYSDNSDASFVSLNSTEKDYGVKAHNTYTVGKFEVLAGADWDVVDYLSTRYSGKSTPTTPYKPDNRTVRSALFSQVTYASGGLHVNGGARFNHIGYRIEASELLKAEEAKETYLSLTPSVGARYEFPFRLNLRASYGRGFSVPDAFKMAGFYSVSEYFPKWDYWWVKKYVGNPDLKPESSGTVDVGVNYYSTNKFINFDVAYFDTRHTDKIVEYSLPDNGGTSFKNASRSVYQGIELMASADFGVLLNRSCKLEVYANFTHMLTNTMDEVLKTKAGADSTVVRDMLYVRRGNGNFGVFYDNLDGFSTRLNARYVGSRLEKDNFAKLRPGIIADDYYQQGGYTKADKILEHPDYLIFDWSVFYTLHKNKRFGITFSNLFDENYTEKDGYNMPGRMVTGSFTYLF